MRVLLAALFFVCGIASAADIQTLGIVIRHSDKTMPANSVETLRSALFGAGKSVARFWKESSYGQVNITGTVYPEVLVASFPATDGKCHGVMMTEAKRILAARGFNLADYKAFMLVHSSGVGCRGAGNGGSYQVTTNNNWTTRVFAHEFGHAIGLPHASALRCVGTKCSWSEYGYSIDVLGQGYGSSNLVHKHSRGWLGGTFAAPSPDRIYTHTAAAGVSVEYTIRRITSYAGHVGVRIPYSTSGTLWIEYRALYGIDGNEGDANWMMSEGALLTDSGIAPNGKTCRPCVIDTTPSTSSFKDVAILPGQSFTHQGYKVETLALTDDTLTVRVTKL